MNKHNLAIQLIALAFAIIFTELILLADSYLVKGILVGLMTYTLVNFGKLLD